MAKKTRTSSKGQRAGRPPSEASRRSIVETTIRLLDAVPIRDLTIEAIAREAGVGKPTIYRRWASKCELVMDAYFESITTQVRFPDEGPLWETISKHVRLVVQLLKGRAGRLAAEMIGEGQSQPDVLKKFRARFFTDLLGPPREAIDRAKAEGAGHLDLDTDLLLDLIYGPICYRLLVGHRPLDRAFANGIAELALRTLKP